MSPAFVVESIRSGLDNLRLLPDPCPDEALRLELGRRAYAYLTHSHPEGWLLP